MKPTSRPVAWLKVCIDLFFFISYATAQSSIADVTGLDPIWNHCSRWQHASVVKNEMLYVDGGIETFRENDGNYTGDLTTPSFVGVNEWIVTTAMNDSWIWKKGNITQNKIAKARDPVTGIGAFNGTIRAALWHGPENDNRIYTFGGTSFKGNTSFLGWDGIQSSTNPLWSFDTQSKTWNSYVSTIDDSPNYGASIDAPDQGLGFYLNGQVDSGSRYDRANMYNNTRNLPGMIIVDLNNQTMVNVSTPGLDSTFPRVGGQMTYLPGVGKRGVLVTLGGAYREDGIQGPFNTQKLATFEEVAVFDISSYFDDMSSNGTWYMQKTKGTIPPARIDTCIVSISAPDNSSHNIYMYGGRDPTTTPNATLYDDVYILSLPSFTWTKLFSGNSPRWGHTCHLVGKKQMLTVGGSLSPVDEGCDWEYRGVAIYDLSGAIWSLQFSHDETPYNVTQALIPTIGGTALGNANLTSPPTGWTSPSLAAVMAATRTPLPTSSTPQQTAAQTQKRKHTATLIGAAVGATVALAILLATTIMYFRIKKQRLARAPQGEVLESAGVEKNELKGDSKYAVEVADTKELAWEMEAGHGYSEVSPTSATTGRSELPSESTFAVAELSGESLERRRSAESRWREEQAVASRGGSSLGEKGSEAESPRVEMFEEIQSDVKDLER